MNCYQLKPTGMVNGNISLSLFHNSLNLWQVLQPCTTVHYYITRNHVSQWNWKRPTKGRKFRKGFMCSFVRSIMTVYFYHGRSLKKGLFIKWTNWDNATSFLILEAVTNLISSTRGSFSFDPVPVGNVSSVYVQLLCKFKSFFWAKFRG